MGNYSTHVIDQYQQRRAFRSEYEEHSERMVQLFEHLGNERSRTMLSLLMPMIAIAWSDGKIGIHEQDAIFRTAEIYGLLNDEDSRDDLVDLITSRPTEAVVEKAWDDITQVSFTLPQDEMVVFATLLYQQTKFVGELGLKFTFGHLSQLTIGPDEQDQLHITQERLNEIVNDAGSMAEHPEMTELMELDANLMQLIPLIKVAWADGRVSKRERELIFDSISHFGIEQTPGNLTKLAEWLDLEPDDAFFVDSLHRLGFELADRQNEDLQNKKYEIISRCTLVADASGKHSGDPGFRICDEEISAVKHIAKILNGRFSQRGDDVSAGR